MIPPSIHPETKLPYVWLTKQTLVNTQARDLPRLDQDAIDKFIDTVEHFEGVEQAQGARKAYTYTAGEEGSPHSVLNAAALQRLSDWVPQLGLHKCKQKSGGFEAVADWRPSSTGRAPSDRNRNLSLSPRGIKDFGADRGYSALDLVMAAKGVDLDGAFAWLSAQLGLFQGGDEFADWNPGYSHQDVVVADPLPPHDPETGEIIGTETKNVGPTPDELTYVPGLVGDLVDWICKTARQPSRVLALGAAITVVGTLVGRRLGGPTSSGTHLYIIALAPLATGKDHALKRIPQLLKAANAGHLVGPGGFMSMTALTEVLRDTPLCVCPIDEFGAFLVKLSHPRSSPHEKAITSLLRSAWGSSFDSLALQKWANTAASAVESPALSLYGASTPGEFFEALQSRDVMNGFLNRFLLINTDIKVRDREPELSKFEVPSGIRAHLGDLYAAAIKITDRERADPHGETVIPTIVPWADAAAEAEFDRVKGIVEDLKEDEVLGPFYARTIEMGVRLATIRAVGQKGYKGVTATDMRWGYQVALLSAQQMVDAANDHMAENEFARHGNSIIRFMKNRRGSFTRRDFSKNMKGVKAKELDEILAKLVEAGRIVESVPVAPRGAGRPPSLKLYSLPKGARIPR